METRVLYKFIEEIRRECHHARLAGAELRTALASLDPGRAAFFVRAFLTHAVTVSRFLWPERPGSAERGNELRGQLKIVEPSPLQLNPMRRHVSSPDETFEDWLNGLSALNYVDFNLMPLGTMAGSPADTFQASLDPDTHQFLWRGSQAHLGQAAEALRRLEGACDNWLKANTPW